MLFSDTSLGLNKDIQRHEQHPWTQKHAKTPY